MVDNFERAVMNYRPMLDGERFMTVRTIACHLVDVFFQEALHICRRFIHENAHCLDALIQKLPQMCCLFKAHSSFTSCLG